MVCNVQDIYSDRILLMNLQTFTYIITHQTWRVAHMRTHRGHSQVLCYNLLYEQGFVR